MSGVLMLCPSAAWGGAERMADTLREEALRAGWRCALELPFDARAQWDAATPREVPWWRWALRARGGYDVVHAHLPWPDRLGAALVAARGVPLVVTFQLLPPPGRWPRDRCFAVPSEQALRVAARARRRVRWVALSQADAATLAPLLGEVSVVRNAPPAPAASPSRLAWPEGARRVLSIGRLDPQKGFDAMLRALAHPSLRALPWHWNVVGEGAERPALESLSRALGLADRVRFVGARPGTDGLVDAELLLAPSRFEGMPLVPLEAAEAGVAALCSRIAPHVELFGHVPDALLPADEGAWPDALARWITDAETRARVALAQRAVVGENPRAAMFDAYARLYREVMAG